MKKVLQLFLSFIIVANLNVIGQSTAGQNAIEVSDNTIKVPGWGEEIFYYGFAENDQVIFDFEEVDKKELHELEISEYSASSLIFSDYKTIRVENKNIPVTQTGIYKFRFKNSNIVARFCKVKIHRIPGNESTKNFNTNVYWKNVSDTTWQTKTRQVLASIDTVFDEVTSFQNQIWLYSRGHSSCLSNAASCTKNTFKITYQSDTEELLVYIVADQKTADGFNNLAKTIAKIGIKMGTAAYTVGGSLLIDMFANSATDELVDNLPSANSGNKIDIFFTDKTNADLWYVDYENRISTYDGMAFKGYVTFKQRFLKSQIPKNEMWLCLKNNNGFTGVPVYVNIVAKRIVRTYKDEQYQDPSVTSYQVPYLKN